LKGRNNYDERKTGAAGSLSALRGPCLAETYIFNYSFPAPPDSGDYSISASGTLTAGNGDPITETRTVDGVEMQITGLLPTFGLTSFDGNATDLVT